MENIQEDRVSEEVAKILFKMNFPYNMVTAPSGCPTQALVIKWLRIKHNIHIFVDCTQKWFWTIEILKEFKYINQEDLELDSGFNNGNGHNLPEEAIEQAILYSLKELIK